MPAEFINNTEDTFPYIESAIRILDDNLNWWKTNHEKLEARIKKAISKVTSQDVTIETRFIIYTGPEGSNTEIKRSTPAIRYTLSGIEPDKMRNVSKYIGNTWEGHIVEHHDEDIIVLFE